jgi:hypothetical protein
MIEDKLDNIAHSLDHIADQIDPHDNLSDILMSINYNIGRVADALEKVVKKMPK